MTHFALRPDPTNTLLAGSQLCVIIDGLVAHHELHHRFHNPSNRSAEIIYTFPIPLDAAFLGMDATIGGETRRAQVQPRHNARQTFDDAIVEGDSAVLLEQLEPGLLCVDLGNLKSTETGEVVLRYATSLSVADGTARFSLPLVQRPRYGRSRLPELEAPHHDFVERHPLEAKIRVVGPLASAAVQCASHAMRFAREADALLLTLGHAQLDRDLVLNFELPASHLAEARLIADGGDFIGLVEFTAPPGTSPTAAIDLCLVLDGSGSMAGDAIAQSRQALACMIDALEEYDRVQVLRFGSRVVPLFRRPLRASARVREAMGELLGTVQADLGGTDIGDALTVALDGLKGGDPARARAIILVTDGAVQPHELSAARQRAAAEGIRIFVVAVGSSAGVDVLAPLASDSGAVLERAVPAEPIDAAVMRQFRRARHARPLQTRIHWGEHARALPLPVLYPGDAGTAIAHFSAGVADAVEMDFGNGLPQTRIALGKPLTDPTRRAWAGQQIHAHAAEDEREALALRYGLITKETSAVLVKVRAEGDKIEGLPEVIAVPHMLPEGMVSTHATPAMARMISPSPAPSVCFSRMDYLSTPSFLRRQAAADPGVSLKRGLPSRFVLESVADVTSESGAPFSDARVAILRLALREALDKLLAGTPGRPWSFDALLQALDPDLRDDATRWLIENGFVLDTVPGAVNLLMTLANEGVGAPLGDDEEAALSVLAFA